MKVEFFDWNGGKQVPFAIVVYFSLWQFVCEVKGLEKSWIYDLGEHSDCCCSLRGHLAIKLWKQMNYWGEILLYWMFLTIVAVCHVFPEGSIVLLSYIPFSNANNFIQHPKLYEISTKLLAKFHHLQAQ